MDSIHQHLEGFCLYKLPRRLGCLMFYLQLVLSIDVFIMGVNLTSLHSRVGNFMLYVPVLCSLGV